MALELRGHGAKKMFTDNSSVYIIVKERSTA